MIQMKTSKRILVILAVVSFAVTFSFAAIAAEHAGEHPGGQAEEESHEHAGEKAHDHHEHDEHAGEKAEKDKRQGTDFSHKEKKQHYGAKEIKTAIKDYIKKDQKLKNGYFYIYDEKLDRDWKLTFSKLHPVRIIERDGEKIYFACTNFKVVGDKKHDVLDLDFWMKPNKHGDLTPYKIRIHKVDGKERFVYKNDRPVKKEK